MDSEVQMDEDPIFDIEMTYQQVLAQEVLTDNLVIKLICQDGEHDLDCEYETVTDPAPEILLRSKLQFAKKRMFDYIQILQQKSRDERLTIYQQIKAIDESMDQGLQ